MSAVRMLPACLLLLSWASLGARPHKGRAAVEAPRTCGLCGMDRVRFARSRMLIEREDGSLTGTCSLHCALEALTGPQESPVRVLWVADRAHPERLVKAGTCTWVIGGDLPGVMAGTATWAFGEASEARAFVSRHGGRVADYEAARRVLGTGGAE